MSQTKPPRIVSFLLTLPLAAAAGGAPPAAPAQGGPQTQPQPQQRSYTTEEENEVRGMLGEKFAEFAPNAIRPGLSPRALRQGEALLEAAMRMNPSDPRYPRQLAETRRQLGDVNGQIAAWTAYRRILPADRVAQNLIIDLYTSRIETADGKLAYLKDLLTKPSLPDDVKAYVAVKAVLLLDQRSHAEAEAMLDQAAKYYPLPEVTFLQYQFLPADAPRVRRFAAVVARLRSNPAQPDALEAGADILANAGLTEQALNWYMTLVDLCGRNGILPSEGSLINYLVEIYRAGDGAAATEKLDQILPKLREISNASAAGWFLRLTMQRGDESVQTLAKAREIFAHRIDLVADQIVKLPATTQPESGAAPGPSTQPSPASQPAAAAAPAPPPDAPVTPAAIQPATPDTGAALVNAAVARAKTADPQIRNALSVVLGELAWFELYFDKKPDAALPPINSLREFLGASDPLVRRLQAWYDLQTGHPEEARKTFTELQDADPLCALGLFRLEEQEKHAPEAEAIGRKILANPRGGTLGAILWQALKGRGLKPATQPAASGEIAAELEKLPPAFLTVLSAPQRFYSLRAEPIHNGRRLGEPLYAVVSVINVGKQDITLGQNGLIKPAVWFDANIRGLAQQTFPAITFDRLMGTNVLRPGQGIQQVVRLDAGELGELLRQRPLMTLYIAGAAVTNAIPTERDARPAAGGVAVAFTKMFTRTPTILNSESAVRKFVGELQNGSPADKLLDLDALAGYVRQYAAPTATPQEKSRASQYLQLIDQYQSDPAPGVKIWSNYLTATLEGPGGAKVIDEMLASNSWESRLMGLIVARVLPADAQKELMSRVALKDADATVKAYATATLDLLQNPTTQPATTQPAETQPSTAPTTEPAAASPNAPPPTTRPANPVGPLQTK
ncbi:MAG: hypothetical protein JWN24_568 [Phycisphaerales bacterium]|nr:hypothetical protein [Phycisphaerales bacterium]